MAGYFLRRLVSLVLVLFCVVSITFFLIRLAPGGPFDRERKIPPAIEKQLLLKYKLDGPEGRAMGENLAEQLELNSTAVKRVGGLFSLGQQYFSYLGDLFQGDLRLSTKYRNRTVNELIAQTLPVSGLLGFSAFVIAAVSGICLGSIAAVRHRSAADAGAMFGALLAISIPNFVVGPLLILVFALHLKWLPVGGWNDWRSLVLPSLTLAAPYVAYIARLMRTSMLEVLSQDFVRTARAKGIAETRVIYKHALKVAVLPVVSFLGPLAANLLTGSIVIETIFNIPGTGGFFVNSILNRDGFLLGGVVIVYCTLLVVLNLVVDLAYGWLDPRIKVNG